MRVDACPPDLARHCWNVLETLVEKGCKASRGEFTPEQVLQRVMNETWVLWIGTDPDADLPLPMALAATHLEEWAGGRRVCRLCFVAADNMDDWQDAFKAIQKYAELEQCDSVVIEGRSGWKRRMGWKPVGYVYEVAV